MPELNEILDGVGDMPTLPDVVAKLTQLIANPKTSAADINDALSRDPGLTAKILKLVNSSYYGFARRITTITNAVVILGYTQVRNLALSAFIYDAFVGSGKNRNFDMKAFWKHCIGTAFLSAGLAKRVIPKQEEDAFICGLLHDLGKCVIAQKSPQDMNAIMERVVSKDILFYAAEHETVNYDHAILGAALMERWNLPEILVEVVRLHHVPLESEPANRKLCCIVNVADTLARALMMGSGGDGKIAALNPDVWALLGLDWASVEAIVRKVAQEYWRSDEFFSMT